MDNEVSSPPEWVEVKKKMESYCSSQGRFFKRDFLF